MSCMISKFCILRSAFCIHFYKWWSHPKPRIHKPVVNRRTLIQPVDAPSPQLDIPILPLRRQIPPPSFFNAPWPGTHADGAGDVLAAQRCDAVSLGHNGHRDGWAEGASGEQAACAGRGAARVGWGRGGKIA